ncbi:cell wall-associated NlpC family hydrolase [Allocatelliglobosispora scoriae]|uniref:Cell wall-associated NlpC family hydrolase n=1 Tax=Allocatelliglobosispora scoriae TaxID=643052 RepID=A0A841BPT6_9ACTN|nr:NlpC/P60 family protein [Allocatelliglobosispora scoriae]MBB5869378.1 cell wall-associated NlpC family hydrolase [Allocatelliglobosispora scoriae]
MLTSPRATRRMPCRPVAVAFAVAAGLVTAPLIGSGAHAAARHTGAPAALAANGIAATPTGDAAAPTVFTAVDPAAVPAPVSMNPEPTAGPAAVKAVPRPPAPPKPPAPKPTKAQTVIALAKQYSGRPYVFGTAGPKTFDCTGYTKFIFKRVGITLPHSGAQGRYGKHVAKSAARPGDLMLFSSGGSVYHVAIYAGKGYMYDAPRPGRTTGLHRIWTSSYEVRRLV